MRSVTLPALLGAILYLTGCEKYSLDRQMYSLCKKDGGLTIHEPPKLPDSRFNSIMESTAVRERPRRDLIYAPEYKITEKEIVIKNGDPTLGQGKLIRIERNLIRNIDKKNMVTSVTYIRSGGDFIYYSHFSSKICPQPGTASIESTFIKGQTK